MQKHLWNVNANVMRLVNWTICLRACLFLNLSIINIDIPHRKLTLAVSDEELKARLKKWKPIKPKVSGGYLSRYAKLVSSADKGAVLS